MTSVLERRRTVILEPELMDSLDLIQGKVAGFDVDYKINTNTVMGGCVCGGLCGAGACVSHCDGSCDGWCRDGCHGNAS